MLLFCNLLHHYETSLFGWMIPFLAPQLFPDKTATEALLYTFLLLPLSHITKPLGALFFGILGDRYGRKPIFIATLLGTSASTFLLGALPPIAWPFLRLFQGFFSAGEEKSSSTYLLELAPPHKRSFLSALYDASGILGILLASLLTTLFAREHWQQLFFLAAFSTLFAAYFRTAPETHTPSHFSFSLFRTYKRPFFQIMIVSGFSYANYYLVSVFLNGILPHITSLTPQEALSINTHLLYFDFLFLLFFGLLSSYIPRETLMRTAALFTALTIIPLFLLLPSATFFTVAVIRLTLVLFGTALAAPYHAWKLDLLPPSHRLTIGATASALGAKLFGSFTPFFSTLLFTHTNHLWTAALPTLLLAIAAFSNVKPQYTTPKNEALFGGPNSKIQM